ncbi:MAG TPA: M4 family metallopeptidase [Kofleriaceae bacterium]|nr:M4 family metallopeptidase [Kofleriaceae bacterium]
MIRLARLSATLLVASAAFAGCTDVPTYQGNAKLAPVVVRDTSGSVMSGDLGKAAIKYARGVDELTGYADDWQVRATHTGSASKHIRMNQVHDGLPVWGADVVLHTRGDQIDFVAGNRVPNLGGFDVEPEVKGDVALATAKADYNSKIQVPRASLAYQRESSDLVIYPQRGAETRLAWHVVFFTERQGGMDPGLWNYFVDAKTGVILDKFNAVHHALAQASGPGGNAKVARQWRNELDVSRSGSQYIMETSRLVTIDMKQQTTGGTVVTGSLDNIGDAAINDAHGFAEVTLNMLSEWQGFNSIDNKGLVIKSRVHYDVQYENAFWDGEQMTYGDGASTFYPLSGDVDVVAHEINHGFTSFHSNLIYQTQSGGLNESFSDIAGTVAEFFAEGDHADFDIGRDIFKGDEALRFMCDPTADGISIDNFASYNDGLDVHFSSGISNKAFCLTARRLASGSPTGAATQASVRRASQAWYRANAAFWTQSTTFPQGCQGTLDAARDVGFSAEEQNALRTSWVDVGVYCDGEVEPLHCDETLTTSHGEVTSPSFPSNYPDNFSRTYCIIPADGAQATLHFTNFDTETGYDFVTLKDDRGRELSKTSGTTAPADVTGSTIVLKFTSDFIINRPGWRATW